MGKINKNNIALVQLPHFYGNGYSRPPECYPLGLGYLSSVLTLHDIQHEGIDLWGSQLSEDQAIEKIDFSRYDVIGVSAYSTQYRYLKNFTQKLKALYPRTPVVCGGPGPTFNYEAILANTGVDVCVLREGEQTFAEIIANPERLENIPGIAFLTEDGVRVTQAREPIKNLDDLPLPNRTLFDFERIIGTADRARMQSLTADIDRMPRRSADIIAGRGCPYACNYCSKTFEGLRLRSVGNIIEEIEELRHTYRINHIRFNDELVLVSKKRTKELCSELKRLNIIWSCQGRINQVDREILSTMRDAGCVEVGYGVESISQEILDAMNKKIRAEAVVPVIKMTREAGITPVVQYMFGYPGENERTIKETIRFFRDIDNLYVGFTVTPLPGTILYEDCRRKGLIVDEEDYLMRLDSGYNLDRPIINLTDFRNDEFLRRKKRLRMIVNHNYLKKRPFQYIKHAVGFVGRRALNVMTGLRSKRQGL